MPDINLKKKKKAALSIKQCISFLVIYELIKGKTHSPVESYVNK